MNKLHLPGPFLLFLFLLFGTVAFGQDAGVLADRWLQERREVLGLKAGDVDALVVTSSSIDRKGIGYIYLQQTVSGLPVLGAVANMAVRDGRVVGFGDRLQRGLGERANGPRPGLAATDALRAAARELDLRPTAVRVLEERSANDVVLAPSGISRDPIPARLVYATGDAGALRLCWELVIRSNVTPNWWRVAVDATTGRILLRTDRMVQCAHPADAFGRGYDALTDLRNEEAPAAPMPPDGSSYRVFAVPTESPNHGPHILLSDPADPDASPFGWHDTNGAAGAEYTITRGNNVHAYEDMDDDDLPGYSPDGGPSLTFDHAYAPPQSPLDYLDASITNLFYTCNMLHDVWHHYGFDATSGNFQANNMGMGGDGSDEVVAQAQDGGGMNNANFGTPPDGESGRMQMYLWRAGVDSSLTLNSPLSIAGAYPIALAGFGPTLPTEPLTADLVLAVDDTAPLNNACEPLTNEAAILGTIAVVDRGQCTFISKVEALQALGAVAVIVVNNVPGDPIAMGGSGGENIVIPAVMISQEDGLLIKEALLDGPVNGTLMAEDEEDLRDSCFDNGIIAHEYGHGVSNRLTGGAMNVDCLWNEEQMGEGWSDYMGTIFTMRPGDEATTIRGMGTFVRDQEPDGPGIRPAPYTTDMSVNPYTYGDTNDEALSQPHGVGFVWATMLWDLTWAMIDQYGFDPDLHNGNGGNNRTIQLMMDGLKLQPCNPGFVDGRDAILLADTLNYDGANACLIWSVFAQRGLGYSADQGDAFSRFDQIEAFDLPPACLSTQVADRAGSLGFRLQPNPANGLTELVLPTGLHAKGEVRIRTADGRLCFTMVLPQGRQRMTLDLQELPAAVYVVELVMDDGRMMTERLVIQ